MKKIIIGLGILVMMCLMVGCGINCSSKPSKRAYIHNKGGLGMQYHFVLFEPSGKLSHSAGCTEYEYIPLHVYVDNMHNVKGDEMVWRNPEGYEVPFAEFGENPEDIRLSINQNQINVSGLRDGYKNLNGAYKIEVSSPDSWGVSIGGNWR